MIRNLEEFDRPGGGTYFTGILSWNRNNRLHFMFDPQLKELFIFKWEQVPREDTKRIYDFMCDTFFSGMKIEELYKIA